MSFHKGWNLYLPLIEYILTDLEHVVHILCIQTNRFPFLLVRYFIQLNSSLLIDLVDLRYIFNIIFFFTFLLNIRFFFVLSASSRTSKMSAEWCVKKLIYLLAMVFFVARIFGCFSLTNTRLFHAFLCGNFGLKTRRAMGLRLNWNMLLGKSVVWKEHQNLIHLCSLTTCPNK